MDTHPKRFAKAWLGGALVWTGVWDRAVRTWARRDHTIVLTYHRVVEKWDHTLDYSQPGMVVTVPTFERQLAFLAEHFDIVSLNSAFVDEPIDRPATRPRCVITFDDGWRDNYDLAFPILRKRGIPATIFVATDFVGTSRTFWHTELLYLLLQPDAPAVLRNGSALSGCPAPVREHLKGLAVGNRIACAADLDPTIEWLKATWDEDVLAELIDELRRAAGCTSPLFPDRAFFLDWDQVGEMAEAGVEIESHGCSHRILTRVPAPEAAEELVRSRLEIERHLHRPVRHLAFPNEAANDALLRSATDAGYRTACVGSELQEAPRGIRVLRRLGMHEQVGGAGPSFDEAALRLWLFRGPKSRPA
jgi:peptidoglycan/xylan/chitin deacetylase (PgdA/CDA1 family)